MVMTAALLTSNIQVVRHTGELVAEWPSVSAQAFAAMQRLRELARQSDGDAELFVRIGEAIFCYLDELAVGCSAGYAEAEDEFAGETERQRRRLLDLLIAEQPAAPETISGLARAVGWRLPRQVAVVALAERVRSVPGPPPLPRDVLVSLTRPQPCILVPDPDAPGRRGLLEAGLRNWPTAGWTRDRACAGYLAALGPAVPLARASGSLRWARRALALAQRGQARGADGIVRCDEHLATLVLLADAELADTLSGQVLAPLRRLPPERADRLALTLLAWLESADNAGAAARRLHVHPQTVRYRLRQLTELFGDRLDDPEARFSLQVALRARQLRAAATSVSADATVRSG